MDESYNGFESDASFSSDNGAEVRTMAVPSLFFPFFRIQILPICCCVLPVHGRRLADVGVMEWRRVKSRWTWQMGVPWA